MIDIAALFTQSLELLWRRKFLWLLGLLMGLNGLAFSLGRLFLRPLLPSQWFSLDYWLDLVQSGTLPAWNVEPAQLWRYVLGSSILLFVYVVVFWVIVTVAEGAIIGAAKEEAEGRQARLGRSLEMGIGYLGRFAAIDAAVFLPLFLLAVVMLAVALADTAFLAYLTLQTDADARTAVGVYALGWLCILSLGCCIPPLLILSVWYRTLAFRDAAVLDHGVRQAMQHTRQVIKLRWGELIALTAFLYGLSYLLGWLLSFLTIPVLALTAVPLATGMTSISGILAGGFNLLITLLVAFLKGLVHAFTAVAWTLAYRELTVNSEQ
jgi:hypothetical protein